MTKKKVQSRLASWADSPVWTALIVVASSRQATQRRTEPRQANTEVHILHVALIATSQRLTVSDSMRYKILSIFYLIIIIILKIIAFFFFTYFLLSSSVTPSASQSLLTDFRKKHILLIYCLFSLASGFSGFVVLNWETKSFSPAFSPAHLEVGVFQLAAKSLDHGPQGPSIQPYFFIPGGKKQLAHAANTAACLLLCLWHPSTNHQNLPTTSLLEKVKGSGCCWVEWERKRWRKHGSNLKAGFNPCEAV